SSTETSGTNKPADPSTETSGTNKPENPSTETPGTNNPKNPSTKTPGTNKPNNKDKANNTKSLGQIGKNIQTGIESVEGLAGILMTAIGGLFVSKKRKK
ncbi:LPXTG cell wall anchor domain-containing protein, partial [Anaerococcus hydrogenalis]|uniref:LPXTG cell wall anchor domain-containing protein n=1 Tax=Anaerococcus hydrogenalis TaxID=33029 RepID=UPI00288C5BD3